MDSVAEDWFETLVDRSGGPDACHPWRGYKNRKGYGQFVHKGKAFIASRVELARKLGRPLGPRMCALHDCPGGDNPACCNPAHLWEGTKDQNNDDMRRKGRYAHGSSHGSHTHPERVARGERHVSRTRPEVYRRGAQCSWAKLTDESVRRIRAEAAEGVPQVALSERYGVSRALVCMIVAGKRRVAA